MYLTREMDTKVLRELKNRLASFSIAFDYMSEEVIAYATGDEGVTGFVERFAAMGAPWITGINDVATFAKEAGLVVADNTTTAALHRAYWPGRPIATRMFDHYSLCTLAAV
jgi:O-methyltransferase involved in polyketide biosynthesis